MLEYSIHTISKEEMKQAVEIINACLPISNPLHYYCICQKLYPNYHLAAVSRGKMIGVVVCTRKINSILIVAIAVKTVFRHYGVGKHLLEKIIQQAQQDQVESIQLHISSLLLLL